jgi:hypothetical protein
MCTAVGLLTLLVAGYILLAWTFVTLRDQIDWRIGRVDLNFHTSRYADVACIVATWTMLVCSAVTLRRRLRVRRA